VKTEFTLDHSIQQNLFQWVFDILELPAQPTEAMLLLRKTSLTFFGSFHALCVLIAVPYARSLETFGLSFRALEVSFQAIQLPETSSPAARAVDKIIRTSSLIGLHIPEVAHAVQNLLSTTVDVVDKMYVVEGYTFLVAQNVDKEDLPQHISVIFTAFRDLDISSCEVATALEVLKVIYGVGKTLHTTSPAKLTSDAWTEGRGREMGEWVREVVATSAGRFSEDFEITEVVPFLHLLMVGHNEYHRVLSP
jgi:hypothetical protein